MRNGPAKVGRSISVVGITVDYSVFKSEVSKDRKIWGKNVPKETMSIECVPL